MIADVCYAAGFIDGEGCIRINKNGSIELTIINTGLPSLLKIKDLFGGDVSQRKQKVNKEQYQYRLYGEGAVNALSLLVPFLIEKQSQALLAIEWWDKRKELQPIRKEGKLGAFAHPLRDIELRKYIDAITKQKWS